MTIIYANHFTHIFVNNGRQVLEKASIPACNTIIYNLIVFLTTETKSCAWITDFLKMTSLTT